MTDSEEHSGSGSLFGKLAKIFSPGSKEPQSIKQLRNLINRADKKSFLPSDVASMIDGVLQVAEMRVGDIMIPRSQMIALDKNDSFTSMHKTLVDSAHSRFPVVEGAIDNVAGILLAKDLLHWCADKNNPDEFNIDDVLRPAIFVPESKPLNIMLREFRNKRIHMAMVVDEYGGTEGLITMEDVLEQIVGDISDEHDIEGEDNNILRHSQIRHTVKASVSLDEFNDYFASGLEHPDIDTIGGLVMRKLGHVPARGEIIDIDRFRIKVLRADKRRIYLLQVNLMDLAE